MSWIVFDERLNEADMMGAAGRSLFVCQHFESTCKDIVAWLCLAKALTEDQFEFLDDAHKDYVLTLLKLFLGKSIERLGEDHPDIPAADIDTLKAAASSRNYICHDLLLDHIHTGFGRHYVRHWDERLHRERVVALAQGDYLVSRWSYEFHEKESGALIGREGYVERVVQWVFADG